MSKNSAGKVSAKTPQQAVIDAQGKLATGSIIRCKSYLIDGKYRAAIELSTRDDQFLVAVHLTPGSGREIGSSLIALDALVRQKNLEIDAVKGVEQEKKATRRKVKR